MRPTPEVHDALALLLTYPSTDPRSGVSPEKQVQAMQVVTNACPEAREPLEAFAATLSELTPGEREELYTRTFDSNDDRSLEVGWQLFGENYARGALMVRLRQFLREHGVEERTELPDHMMHVLPLLGRAPEALASALACNQVKQAVAKMIENLEAAESPYASVLEAVQRVLARHAPAAAPPEGVATPEEVAQ